MKLFPSLVCLVLCLETRGFTQCRVPQFRRAVTLVDSKSQLLMNVSVSLSDFAPNSLVCLAASLKRQHPGRVNIVVNIFTSHRAASRSIGVLPPEYTATDLEVLAQMHARYVFDSERGEDYLEIMPFGAHPYSQSLNTRIELPVAISPICRLALDRRCLIAMKDLTYPHDALKAREFGAVTLAAVITRAGGIVDVRAVKVTSRTEGTKLLVDAAIENLSSWRVEPGSHRDYIEITYSYVLDNSLPEQDNTRVLWALPSEVTVKGRPF